MAAALTLVPALCALAGRRILPRRARAESGAAVPADPAAPAALADPVRRTGPRRGRYG